MPVEAVASSPTPLVPSSGATAPKKTMDSDVFMKLLVTQLTNQDPSTPMDTNQMISQTTQLAMMEQLTSMSRDSSEAFALHMRQAATALVGQQVSYLDATGTSVSGVVTKVSFDGPIPRVSIGDATVALDEITSIATRTADASTPV